MTSTTFEHILVFIRDLFHSHDKFLALHEPRFIGNEKAYLAECIDSTFVSSVGKFVDKAEEYVSELVGKPVVSLSNGTLALHTALYLSDVRTGDIVLTQPLTFAATGNAIKYCGATPLFIDVEETTMGMSPDSLKAYLNDRCEVRGGICYDVILNKPVKACIPVHIFGFPCRVDEICEICREYNITVVEDAAESLGSLYKDQHTGTFGDYGTYSLNGNKIVTSGGGGFLICSDVESAKRAKHITTTAKRPHPWEYYHDELGFNYRMPNINAALALAQLENLDTFVQQKRKLAHQYRDFFAQFPDIDYVEEPANSRSNYWLNTIRFGSVETRNAFLEYSNSHGVMTRPAWTLLNRLPAFDGSFTWSDSCSCELQNTIVNIPSSAI